MPAAGRNRDSFAFTVLHTQHRRNEITGRMDAFNAVAQRKLVLDLDFHQTTRSIESDGITNVKAAVGFGMAAQVILVIGIVIHEIAGTGLTISKLSVAASLLGDLARV